jgi:serine/threonine protein phosphatase PrpC
MVWEIATAQSLGGRGNQEDSVLAIGPKAGQPILLAVADGAGGHADGEKASQAAIRHLTSAFADPPRDEAAARKWLAQSIEQAHGKVSALGQGPTAPRTTIVAAWIGASAAMAGHVGDSRLYHFRAGKLVMRTRDHSVVQLLLDMGRLKEAEIRNHPDRSRLTKALGGNEVVEPDVEPFSIQPGDALALCSDGVWEHAEPSEFASALQARDLRAAARQLVDRAVSRGGPEADNATLILARLG